ncbi:hypothetical protein [Tengunoibacter tsumagoiensis]|uniref:Uncharacterized protein n=1 Tax=Tengunoibacter tsumagoiensis TaxID=2014871 RepID=A0A401ZUX4_9CHLR|nr:hypothetical protein [Tengunoibacter tsumagoiensis]GCE10637.1 hypothetical protein KTT_04960 [Tengunoibacter tsumagoiensis]
MNVIAGQGPEISPLYTRQTAIDHSKSLPGLFPVRIFPLLYPLWNVEIEGTQLQEQPSASIERYLLRGIVEGDLHTSAELATFFQLDLSLVQKVITFLLHIQHLEQSPGGLVLTHLGQRSLSAGKRLRYLPTRQRLYFDAFLLQPLPLSHYDPRLRILSSSEAEQAATGKEKFQRLFKIGGPAWDEQAVLQLVQRSDRANFALPDELNELRIRAVMKDFVYLPLYLIEARSSQSPQPYYMVYSRVQTLRDNFFEQLINQRLQQEVLRPLAATEPVAGETHL